MDTKKLRILLAYNQPHRCEGNSDNFISQTAVKQEADDVHEAIREMGHHSVCLAVNTMEQDLSKIRQFAPDVIFNLCEGYRGNAHREMHIAAVWDLLEIPYTGNTPFTLALAQNKVMAKRLFESKKIRTPMYQVYSRIPQTCYLNYPVIAKPAMEDASLGITGMSVIHDFRQLRKVVDELLETYKQPVLVEKFIQGREFNVSIYGNNPPVVLPISEISFTDLETGFPAITSYEAKWMPDHPLFQKTPAVCPAHLPKELRLQLVDVALHVYHLLMGRDYGRVDIRVDPGGQIYVLEFNPNPDISREAGFARALKAGHIKYKDFIQTLINEAISRKCRV